MTNNAGLYRRRAGCQGYAEFGDAAGWVWVVGEGDGAFVGGGDLLGEDEADAASFGFGGVEGDEEIGWVEQAGAGVDDPEDRLGGGFAPADDDAWRGLRIR